MKKTCNRVTTEDPASLLPKPYNLPFSTTGKNGSYVQPATGFTVSICEQSNTVGRAGSKPGLISQMLLSLRDTAYPCNSMYRSSKSATFFSSLLKEGMAMIFFSKMVASCLYS